MHRHVGPSEEQQGSASREGTGGADAGLAAGLPCDLFLRVAPDGRILDAAVPGPHLVWEASDLVGTAVEDLLHPDSAPVARQALGELIERGRNRRIMQVRTGDGAYRWMVLAVRLVRDEDGRPVAAIGIGTDVEELVERIRLLEQSEHRYRLLAEGATDGVALGRGGIIEWVVGPSEARLGWPPEELAGQRFLSLVHPDDHAAALEALAATERGESSLYEVRLRAKSGDYRWCAFRMDAVVDAEGTFLGRVSRWRDVHDLRDAEARRETLEDRAPTAIDSDLAVIFEMDADAKVRWISGSVTALLGYEPAELMGRAIVDFVVPDDAQKAVDAHARRSASGLAHLDEVRVVDAHGAAHWVSATTVEVTDDRGIPLGYVGLLHDVHDRVAARRELAMSEERLRLAMRSAPIGMGVVGLDRRFRVVNPALGRLLGRDDAWLLGHGLADVLAPEVDADDLRHRVDLVEGGRDAVTWEHEVRRPDGSSSWVEHSTALIRDPEGEPSEYVIQLVDVTQARRTHERLHFEATHDALTRVGNRRVLDERLLDVLGQEGGARGGALLFVDVDRLKEINDEFGHAAGDEVLVRVAERIARQVRADDVVARFGGDEFALLLPGITDEDPAARVADEILGAMSEPVVWESVPVPVTVSIGITLVAPGGDPEAILRRADTALYRAKRAGRGSAATAVDAG